MSQRQNIGYGKKSAERILSSCIYTTPPNEKDVYNGPLMWTLVKTTIKGKEY